MCIYIYIQKAGFIYAKGPLVHFISIQKHVSNFAKSQASSITTFFTISFIYRIMKDIPMKQKGQGHTRCQIARPKQPKHV